MVVGGLTLVSRVVVGGGLTSVSIDRGRGEGAATGAGRAGSGSAVVPPVCRHHTPQWLLLGRYRAIASPHVLRLLTEYLMGNYTPSVM